MKKIIYMFLAIILFSPIYLLTPAHAADPLHIDVTEDTFSNEAYPDRDFSTAGSVVLSQTPTNREGYFIFDSITLPESAILQSVDFNFYINDFNGDADSATLEFRDISTEWAEDSLNWDNKPPTSGSLNHTIDTVGGWKKVDITNLAQDWYGIYMVNNGIFVRASQPDMAISLASSNSENTPYLEINYIIDMPAPPVECPLAATTPADESRISDTRPTFRWGDITCLSSDVAEVRLFVNEISDDGADASEIINISIPVDSTFFTPTEDLEFANYRWYIATLNSDGIGIDRSESNGFEIFDRVKDSVKDGDDKIVSNKTGQKDTDTNTDTETPPNSYIMLYVVLMVCLIFIAIIVTYLVTRRKKDKHSDSEPPLFQ